MGHRITRAASHLSTGEVKERMRTDARPWVRRHWWIVYNALVAPRKAEEIALHTGVSATTVHRVIATYNRLGPAAIDQSAKGGRHHEYLTVEQIKSAWEAEVKQEVHSSSVYRLLDRHGWRKLVPRPRHPKANPEEQAAFKKTFKQRSKRP